MPRDRSRKNGRSRGSAEQNGSAPPDKSRSDHDHGERGTRADGWAKSLELPMLMLPTQHPCHRCGECCRYIAVEIDRPTCNGDYDHIFWYLTHRAVAVYVDWEGDWYLEFQTSCDHLTDEATCGIYPERPKICSDFSWETCERNMPEPAARYRFEKPQEFFDWLRARRPRAFERFTAFREKLASERAQARRREARSGSARSRAGSPSAP